jgi:hypothetical protein
MTLSACSHSHPESQTGYRSHPQSGWFLYDLPRVDISHIPHRPPSQRQLHFGSIPSGNTVLQRIYRPPPQVTQQSGASHFSGCVTLSRPSHLLLFEIVLSSEIFFSSETLFPLCFLFYQLHLFVYEIKNTLSSPGVFFKSIRILNASVF